MTSQKRVFAAISLTIGAALSIAACQTESQIVMQREDNLAAAGFIVKPDNTLERQQMLHRLPPHTFVQRANGDVIHYFLRIRSCVAAYMWAPSRRTTLTNCISNSKISPMSKP